MPNPDSTILTLHNGTATPLNTLDVGDLDKDFCDLEFTGGNLYLALNGVEIGSLWIHNGDDGEPRVSLGCYDPDAEQWMESDTLPRHL